MVASGRAVTSHSLVEGPFFRPLACYGSNRAALAGFNVGYTLHSLLHLPTHGEFKALIKPLPQLLAYMHTMSLFSHILTSKQHFLKPL